MKQQFTLHAILVAGMLSAQQIPFVNQTTLLPTSVHGGNSIAVCDMNNDGKDDIVRAANGNSVQMIDYQAAANDTFTEAAFTGVIGDPWGLCVGDIDNNGFNDVMWGDYGTIRMMHANATGTDYTSTNIADPSNFIFVQGCNFFDINNDGDLDAFVCNDVDMPHIYTGDGTGTWNFNQSIMPLATFPASDNSGNYASIWTDVNADGLIDLMITHCRQGVTSSADARRIDQVFINNGNGSYTQDTTNWTGLRDGAQGWSTAWGDIDNDGDMDAFVLNYDVNSKLMINNGSGVFTNTISTSGINNTTTIFGENATFQDFNNDGYVDLFISGDTHLMYINNGNGTFTLDQNAFVYSGFQIISHAVGDLNGDGFLDMYASYCDIFQSPSSRPDRMWMNNSPNAGNTNHWIKFYLQGVTSNLNGIGAIIKIYGPWGVQVREIRSGEAYGIQNSFTAHFGIGANTVVDSVLIQWPSGTVDALDVVNADQTITIIEGNSPLSTHDFDQHGLELSIYPNPVKENAIIRLDHFAEIGLNNLSLNIYDINGKLIYTEGTIQNSIIVIDRSLLSSGMYFVEVTNGNERVAAKKMMVE
ncbi:MAG: FG-GAP-like repeat-containing protein [Bacteroidota bacterium]|nr:FG-GAP-like repeat-containing protein [Bacteroidota bacterium]